MTVIQKQKQTALALSIFAMNLSLGVQGLAGFRNKEAWTRAHSRCQLIIRRKTNKIIINFHKFWSPKAIL